MRASVARNGWAALVAVLSVVGVAGPASAKNHYGMKQTAHTVHVLVYNYAGISDQSVGEAEKEASRVFAQAGVSLVWQDCSSGGRNALSDPTCISDSTSAIRVRLAKDTGTAKGMSYGDTLGFAIGQMATISCEKIRKFSALGNVEFEWALGDAIAHELAHLLMPGHPHAVDGIMRAEWNGQQQSLIQKHSLNFISAEMALIRANAERLGGEEAGVVVASVADKR